MTPICCDKAFVRAAQPLSLPSSQKQESVVAMMVSELANVAIEHATWPAPVSVLGSASGKYPKYSCNTLRAASWEKMLDCHSAHRALIHSMLLLTYVPKLGQLRESLLTEIYVTINSFTNQLCLRQDTSFASAKLLHLWVGNKSGLKASISKCIELCVTSSSLNCNEFILSCPTQPSSNIPFSGHCSNADLLI